MMDEAKETNMANLNDNVETIKKAERMLRELTHALEMTHANLDWGCNHQPMFQKDRYLKLAADLFEALPAALVDAKAAVAELDSTGVIVDRTSSTKKELVLHQVDLDETPGHACFFTSPAKKAKFGGGFFTDGKRAFAKTKTGLVYTFDEGSRKWTKFAEVK